MTTTSDLETAWDSVVCKARKARSSRIIDLFGDTDRAEQFSISALGMLFDYSKTHIDVAARDALLNLARAARVESIRDAMFSGARINCSEDRAVLHTALRNLSGAPVIVDDVDVMPRILETLERMKDFSSDVRAGCFRGQGGMITDVINIGIGGSDLGPAMATRALSPFHDGPRCHFVSNVDSADLVDVLCTLDPTTTLVIIASKTFSTIETMTNAVSILDWMQSQVADPATQCVAVSSAVDRVAEFGIPPERTFGFEDWVGGRYSVWGPIGLSLMIAVGPEEFTRFLAGGAEMDAHFRAAPLPENLPVMLALVGLWHHQGMGFPTRAVLPYEHRLARLPAYLQQLEMESNGKRVGQDGHALSHGSGPIVWGEPGTNGQHAFFQLLHQGTEIVPCEFMIGAEGHEPNLAHHHRLLVANCLAQSEALMKGRSLSEAYEIAASMGYSGDMLMAQAEHRVFEGNRPSTTLAYPCLTPRVLGQILALYEHRVFVEGVILGLNSFDQWGVELGKELARRLEPLLAGKAPSDDVNQSTLRLAAFLRAPE
ncbi:MAG: glucose-6-phosphate isomerase [Rhodobacteraceae bacterium HLUCCO07]|nr:MAG: glucose-6-phosphate isomerase [Rhodobacteraceae bacterium HLUCCO07]